MKKKQFIIFLILFCFLSPNALAYSLNNNWNEYIDITQIEGLNTLKGDNLKVDILVEVHINRALSNYTDNFTIFLWPFEKMYNLPIEDVDSFVYGECSNRGHSYEAGSRSLTCKNYTKPYIEEKDKIRKEFCPTYDKCYDKIYKDYKIVAEIPKLERDRVYFISITYIIPHFILKQDKYYVAWLNFPNLKEKNLINFLMLPAESSIPRWVPENVKTHRIKDRWVFEFNGSEDRFFWYFDVKEEQSKRIRRDIVIIAITFAFSLVLGFLFSDKKLSKRTKNFWMLSGLFLFLTAGILFYDPEGYFWTIILVFCYLLFFLWLFLALASGKKDRRHSSLKRDLYEIIKFMKSIANR